MQVTIKETGKIEELTIRDASGIEWTSDLIGNTGAFGDGQFVRDDESGVVTASQDTYDWWQAYIAGQVEVEEAIASLRSDLADRGIGQAEVAELVDRIRHETGDDYESQRDLAMAEIKAIRDEYSEVREYVLLTDAYTWGGEIPTEDEQRRLCECAEQWLTDHEGDDISICVRRARPSEIAGLYERKANGDLQILGCSVDAPADVEELTNRAWEYALQHALGEAK